MEPKELVGGIFSKAKDAASATGILGVYEKGAQRAKTFGSTTKLTLDVNRDRRDLERVFAEIGKLRYEQERGLEDAPYALLFQKVDTLRAAIAEKEAQIEAYKAALDTAGPATQDSGLSGDIADFEDIVNQTETDGTST